MPATIVYAAVEFNSESHRDSVMKIVMAGPEMAAPLPIDKKPIFDYKRMVCGGFKVSGEL